MISIRNAEEHDLPGILEVEESWPPTSRAGSDKFLSRLARFGEGFFLATLPEAKGSERIIASITSMPVSYDPYHLDNFHDWDSVTNKGYLPAFVDWEQVNGLYIVSGVIDHRYRGYDVFAPMVLRIADLAKTLGLRYILAGAVLPGYRKYCEKHGDTDAFVYCRTRRGKHLADPLLTMYESIGFVVRNRNHVIPKYYPDNASKDFAALVSRDLVQHPL
jgi:hypothetical protein